LMKISPISRSNGLVVLPAEKVVVGPVDARTSGVNGGCDLHGGSPQVSDTVANPGLGYARNVIRTTRRSPGAGAMPASVRPCKTISDGRLPRRVRKADLAADRASHQVVGAKAGAADASYRRVDPGGVIERDRPGACGRGWSARTPNNEARSELTGSQRGRHRPASRDGTACRAATEKIATTAVTRMRTASPGTRSPVKAGRQRVAGRPLPRGPRQSGSGRCWTVTVHAGP